MLKKRVGCDENFDFRTRMYVQSKVGNAPSSVAFQERIMSLTSISI